MEFDQLFSDVAVNDYVTNRVQQENVIDTLFPTRKQEELDLKYLKGTKGLPVVAAVHAFDAKTQIASRENVGEFYDELVLVKRQIPIYERDIIRLRNTNNDGVKQEVINQIFNDVDNMVTAVTTRVKAMAAEVLATGQLVINENGANLTVDYGMPAAHKETLTPATDTWDVATVNPLDHIFEWTNQIVDDTGTTPTRALTSRKIISHLLKSEALRKAIYGINSDKLLTLADLNELMAQQGLPRIATFDHKYRVQADDGTYTTNRYIADNLFILLPPETLGEQIYGPTAEEHELLGKYGSDVKSVGNVIAQIYRTQDPVSRWTKAVATALPAFPQVDEVFVGKVLA